MQFLTTNDQSCEGAVKLAVRLMRAASRPSRLTEDLLNCLASQKQLLLRAEQAIQAKRGILTMPMPVLKVPNAILAGFRYVTFRYNPSLALNPSLA